MESLRTLQEIFDNNQEKITDGEYLKAMNTLKLLFEREKDIKKLEQKINQVFFDFNRHYVSSDTDEASDTDEDWETNAQGLMDGNTFMYFPHITDPDERDRVIAEYIADGRRPLTSPPPPINPQVPDPNLPRQRRDNNIPLFNSMEQRQTWIEQNNRHECEFCGYILRTRTQLLNHQQRSVCERLRNVPRTRPMFYN